MIVLKLGEHVLLYGVDPTLVDHVSLSVQRDLHIRIGDYIKVFFDVAKAGYLILHHQHAIIVTSLKAHVSHADDA